ncbi:MAG: NADH-quinone oxidoreductase subunit A [Deltaproteobacteria bacterium]|nr:NADH-quinone oxidoreductase subunit A [Deltaproteobacteria bacterium]
MDTALWPFALYFFAVLALVVIMIGLSYFLGESHKERTTGEPYESGIPITGSAQIRFNASFYLIAVFFVIFDLETLFIISWAVSARELGWAGYIEMLVFIGVLFVALIYLWRVGAMELRSKTNPVNRLQREENSSS